MDSTVRGIFLPARHALFFYRGIGFFFDAGVVTEARRWAEEIVRALALDDEHVEVHVGPPDAVIHGAEFRQERLGTIEPATAGRRTMQSSGRALRAADRERSAAKAAGQGENSKVNILRRPRDDGDRDKRV